MSGQSASFPDGAIESMFFKIGAVVISVVSVAGPATRNEVRVFKIRVTSVWGGEGEYRMVTQI